MIAWPSVTQIIRHFGLMVDYEALSNLAAMRRGRLVTAGCHLLAADKELGEDWEARHPECHAYLDAYRRFLRGHNFQLIEAEHEYRNEALRFIAHPDQIGILDGEGPIDLELKSGGMPRWCQLQTAGQVLAAGMPAMKRFALHLKPDASFTLIQHEDFRDLDRFRSMIDTWWTWQDFRPRMDEGAIP